MTEQDIQVVSIILKGIPNPDNKIRNEAVAKLEEMRKNTPVLLFCLIKILNSSTDRTDKTVSAVLIRKILEIKDDQICSPHWKNLNKDDQESFKLLALQALVKEEDKSLIAKISECVIQIAQNAYNAEETSKYNIVWPDLVTYSMNSISLEVNQTNLVKIECGLRLFDGIYGFIYELLLKDMKLTDLLAKFNQFMKSKIPTLASRTVETVAEMSFYASKKEIKSYKDVILPILEVTYLCYEQGKENELKVCCKSIIEMCTENTGFLFKAVFPDLFILMGKISEKKDYDDDNVRELAFEVILNLVEYKPVLFTKDLDRTKIFIEALIKYSLGMDNEITDDWLNPSQLSYFDMETIYEKEVSCSISFIERIVEVVGSETLLPILSKYISDLIGNTTDWRFKYIGILLFKLIITQLDDMVTVDELFPVIFDHTNHQNAKIRYASLNTLEELADTFKPYFSDKYAEKLIPIILSKFDDQVLKVQLEATEALNTLITNTNISILEKFIGPILDSTFKIFLLDNLSNNLRECLLNVVATLSSEVQEKLSSYASKVFSLICEFFNNSYTNQIHKPLYGNLIECITLIGPFDKETYYKIIPSLVTAILQIQDSIPLSTDPIRAYIQDSLPRIVYILKDNFKDLIPLVIDSTMKLIKTIPEMYISGTDEKFKLDDLLSMANSDPNEVKIKMETNIKTTSTEEMASAIETLNKIIESLGELYLPFIDITNKEILTYLTYHLNDDIRQYSSDTIPILLSIIRKYSDKTVLTHYAKIYTSELMRAIECEIDNETLAYMLENLKEVIETADGFLIKEEVNQLFKKFLVVFDEVEGRRLRLIEKKGSLEVSINKKKCHQKTQEEDDSEDEEERLEKEISDDIEDIEDIQSEMTDLIGKLFSTHKAFSEDVINVVINQMIPKYFRADASAFETKMGIFLVDDIIEFLGQDSMTNDLWHQMAKALIIFASNQECTLRQASLYGLGMFAKETKRGFEVYANECLESIYNGLSISSDNKDETDWQLARDNGVAALGKILKHQASFVDVKLICSKWVSYLPIKEDEEEMIEQHELLCDIILNKPDILFAENLSNAPEIFKLLARIYNSKFSDEKINTKIKQITAKIKADSNMLNILKSIYEGSKDDKIKKRIQKLLED